MWVPIVFELFFWLLFLNSWNFTHTTYIIHSFKQKMNNIGIVFHLHIYKKTARQRSERNRVCARERVVQGTWYCTIVVYIPRTHTEGGTCHVSRGTGVPHRVDVCSKFKIDNGTWNSRTRCTHKVVTRLSTIFLVTLALNLHSQRQTNSGLASDYIKYQIPWYPGINYHGNYYWCTVLVCVLELEA